MEGVALPCHRDDSPMVVLGLVRQGMAILQRIDDEVVSPILETKAGNKVIVYFHSVRMLGQSLMEDGRLVLS